MTPPLPPYSFELALNRLADPVADYGLEQAEILNAAGYRLARETISAWPGYGPTPLISLAGLAEAVGVASVHYKDESQRFGLGSFKALGGAYGVARLLHARVAARHPEDSVSFEDVLAGRYGDTTAGITVTCATDGNHGRVVAWGAQTFGCRCVIFIHSTVSEGRKRAIEELGAQVLRTAGNYDASVREAQVTAEREGWFVVSDTSYEGYMEVPRDVMQGYTVMAAEAAEQLGDAGPPSHLFLQTGVGGMAAAVTAQFWQALGHQRPATVLVDPRESACWLASIKAGRPTAVEGDLETIMAGLACGEISLLAWKILAPSALAAMTVDDDTAADCMRLLADGRFGDRPVVAGESAVAGLAGLIAAAADPRARRDLGLSARSRVLLFGTEGDTDPAVYQAIVGRSAAAVRGS
jgi:diaminopropionate ammonia-lyase